MKLLLIEVLVLLAAVLEYVSSQGKKTTPGRQAPWTASRTPKRRTTRRASLFPDTYNPCTAQPCKNGGSCKVNRKSPGGYKCYCLPGYDPKNNCEECSDQTFGDKCKHECRFCHKDFPCDPFKGCGKCQYGMRNSKSKINDCAYIDCKYNPCRRGGVCRESRCSCPPNAVGDLCEKLVDPDPVYEKCDNKGLKCSNGGTCYVMNEEQGRTFGHLGGPETLLISTLVEKCLCPAQYAGKRCQKTCKTGSQNCVHGFCVGKSSKRKLCQCHAGWKLNEPYCKIPCDLGYWGTLCQSKCGHCAFTPCHHVDGECPPGGCKDGYAGVRCDISPAGGTNSEEANVFQESTAQFTLEGGLSLQGVYPDDPERQKLLKRDTSGYLLDSSRRALAGGKSFRQSLSAKVKISRGSVLVDFTLNIPRDLGQGRDLKQDITQGLKNNVHNFRTDAGNYTVDRSSIQVTSVSEVSADTDSSSDSSSDISFVVPLVTMLVVLFFSIMCTVFTVKRRSFYLVTPHRRPSLAQRGKSRTSQAPTLYL